MKRTTIFSLFIGVLLATTELSTSAQTADPKTRLQTAEAMFQERCKKAGEFIHRTAEGVEGIFLMKLRPSQKNFSEQFSLYDPYGDDVGGDGYIQNFLRGRTAKGSISSEADVVTPGYRYVEAIDPKDGKRYRYTGSVKEVTKTTSMLMGGDGKTTFKTKEFVLDRVPASSPIPRYGVTYDDLSTREEREYWIAGSSLKVIDLQTNEVMAERIGYMMDRGQGNISGGRSPWLLAARYACPNFPVAPGGNPVQFHQTRNFVEKVIKPKLEN